MTKDFLFKEENEWRYVPRKDQIGGGYISENRSKYLLDEKKYNRRLLAYPLKFSVSSDIICVYYARDDERGVLSDRFPTLEKS